MIRYAPGYLAYADKPEKSDIIVIFVGPGVNERLKECYKLIEEGYAENLIVRGNYGRINRLKNTCSDLSTNLQTNINMNNYSMASMRYPNYLEGTEKEILAAKKTIEEKGYRSAIFVSSPLHMRRIKIIAENVFDRRLLQMKFVPTRYSPCITSVWFLNVNYIKMVALEYIKIVWYIVYRIFVDYSEVEKSFKI